MTGLLAGDFTHFEALRTVDNSLRRPESHRKSIPWNGRPGRYAPAQLQTGLL
jgi:hypothetical protein